ncbi:hypothetical protein GYB14_10100 [bacterium]|nr:hypothetical protein [bacterium]
MTYTYIRREQTLEELAETVIARAKNFVESSAKGVPTPTGLQRRNYLPMLARFESGDVLDERDDRCLEAVGRALSAAIEEIVPGYATVVLEEDTSEDFFFNKRLEELRDHLVQWQNLCSARNRLRSRIRAQQLIAAVQD